MEVPIIGSSYKTETLKMVLLHEGKRIFNLKSHTFLKTNEDYEEKYQNYLL